MHIKCKWDIKHTHEYGQLEYPALNDFVHPDLRPSLVDYQTLDISLEMLELFRQGMRARYVAYNGVEDGIAVEEIMIPGLEPDFQLRALCYSPMNMVLMRQRFCMCMAAAMSWAARK